MAQNIKGNSDIVFIQEEEDKESNDEESTTYLQQISKTGITPSLPLLLKPIQKKGFDLKELIGRGHYSDVYRATWTQLPGIDIACKRIKLQEVDEDWKEKCLDRELKIIKKLKHKNIIEVYEMFRSRSLVYIFMEFAVNGSIREYMFKNKYPLKESQAKILFVDLMAGISYIHSRGVAHRDLKLDNFLLNKQFVALISDFGFAVMESSNKEKLLRETLCGTYDYMAPEVQTSGPNALYDAKKADIYSMGISLYEMINYDKPYDSSSLQNPETELLRMKRKRNYRFHKKIDRIISNDIKHLIHKLLEPDPQKRLTIEQINGHKALQT